MGLKIMYVLYSFYTVPKEKGGRYGQDFSVAELEILKCTICLEPVPRPGKFSVHISE